jgi:hypothetical protein
MLAHLPLICAQASGLFDTLATEISWLLSEPQPLFRESNKAQTHWYRWSQKDQLMLLCELL